MASPEQRIDVTGREAWASLVANAYVPLRVDSDDPRFRGAMRERQLGDLAITQVASTRVTVSRTARSVLADPREVYLLCLFLRGGGTTVQDGRVSRFTGGGAFLLNGDQPYSLRFGDGNEMLTLRVPATDLAIREHSLRRLTSQPVPQDAPGIHVLRRHLSTLMGAPDPGGSAHAAGTDPEEQREVALELLRATLHPMLYSERSRALMSGPAILASARWLMEQNFADPRLTVEEVARQFMVSRRHLEAQFARLGTGPAAYLRQIRLEHAARLLTGSRRGESATVGLEVGFNDINTFARAFRRRFGVTPDEWRRRAQRRRTSPPVVARRPPLPDLLTDLGSFDVGGRA